MESEIADEIAVITKICTSKHRNIVQVMHHDWFESSFGYFIDMELCDLTLHEYINNRSIFVQQRSDFLNPPIFVSDDCSMHLNLLNIWTIITHIAQGLEFIHRERYSHRDLKPPNSKWIT